ncbi:beta-fructofuranosidase [Rhodovulum sp. ES.010]|uniref:glycoside hydrolase family 32 protein n=1 Tax=Rhodovulum sp. ES.010 TaxID=1882821 RepID=UPI0009261DF5|nr:glycoside hydrolase family 32 protein [Rhodovulum sp. ES.010]SIO38248.1 beta-fructofuranosidase [Rhodovulum sp. ES.010]
MLRLAVVLAGLLVAGPLAAQTPERAKPGPPAGTVELAGFEPDAMSGLASVRLRSPWHEPTFVEGTDGRALRFDGYSTFVEGVLPERVSVPATLRFDLAVWSWPVARAGLVVLHGPPRIAVTLNRWGRLVATAETPDGVRQVVAPKPLTRGTWHSVALRIGAEGDVLDLYLDGARIGQSRGAAPAQLAGGVTLGRDATSGLAHGAYQRGVLNGALDRVRLTPGAVPTAALRTELPTRAADLRPSPRRFEDDPHRPRYHPMPPAGWTNEPHGLIRADGRWHLYYQANPNGPWWEHMQWGHLVSEDLARWEARKTALWPTPGFDRAGIWVGDVMPDRDGFRALYSGVNGQWAGVGMAETDGTDLGRFEKSADNPVIVETPPGYQDMRDPFVIRRKDDWLMLIGAGRAAPQVPTILTYSSPDMAAWTFEGELQMGAVERFGTYWELPKLLRLRDDRHALIVTTVKPHTPARTQYWIGDWDGRRFLPDDLVPRPLDLFGTHLAQSTHPLGDGRHAAIGIVPETARTTEERLEAGWIHGFSLARTIDLSEDGRHLVQRPAEAVQGLFGPPAWEARDVALDDRALRLGNGDASVARIELTIDPGDAHQIVVALRATADRREATRLRLFPVSRRIALDFSDSSASPTARSDSLWERYSDPEDGAISLTLFVDRSFVDGFMARGEAFAFRTFPTAPDANAVFLSALGGAARLVEARVATLVPAPNARTGGQK